MRCQSSERKAPPAQRVEEPPLSPRRAFVVQFREATGDPQDRFAGRVEHMVSGQAAHFRCAQQLTRFLRQVLRALDSEGKRNRRNEAGRRQKRPGPHRAVATVAVKKRQTVFERSC